MKIAVRKATVDEYNIFCDLIDDVDSLHRQNLPHIFKKTDGPIRELDYYLGLMLIRESQVFDLQEVRLTQ